MVIFKKMRERILLLEYENEILSKKIREIEKQLPKPIVPIFPHPQIIREDGWDLSYRTLRKKYRDHEIIFNDGL